MAETANPIGLPPHEVPSRLTTTAPDVPAGAAEAKGSRASSDPRWLWQIGGTLLTSL